VIADDSASLRCLLVEMVTSLGGEVVCEAPDGYAAIVAAVALEPDVVIMDWHMPDLDGQRRRPRSATGVPGSR
jgi:CheY-like chemotaxis protein